MPPRNTSGFNNPAIGQAFGNIADIFRPPSAQEIAAYAAGQLNRQKASIADQFWRMSQDPNVTPEQLDRAAAVAAGGYTPMQGYGALKQKGEIDNRKITVESGDRRRGQDLESGDRRYGVDARERGDTTRALIAPRAKDTVQDIPPNVAMMYGIPTQRMGVIAAQPGEKNYLPDGRVLEGSPKPVTETEAKGSAFNRLSPEEQRAITFGATPVDETRRGPMTRTERLDTRTPAQSDKQPQAFNSSRGPVIWDPARGAYVPAPAADGADVSGGLQAPGGVQSKDPLGATTANQTQANNSAAQDTMALNQLDLYETLIRNNPGALGIVGSIRGLAQDTVASAQDLAKSFGARAPVVKAAADQVRAGLQSVAPEFFDPSIPQADFLKATIAYAIARTENPSGEVSRQAFERAMNRMGGGLLANSQQVLAQIDAYRQVLKAKQGGTDALRNPGAARTGTGYKPPDAPAPAGPRVFETPAGRVTIEPVQ